MLAIIGLDNTALVIRVGDLCVVEPEGGVLTLTVPV